MAKDSDGDAWCLLMKDGTQQGLGKIPASHKIKEKLEDADVARRVVTPTCEDRCDRAPHIFSMGSGESRG